MGDLHGRLRDIGWCVQQLCAVAGRKSGYSGRCVCARMSAQAGAVAVCDHIVAGKDSGQPRKRPADLESCLMVELRCAVVDVGPVTERVHPKLGRMKRMKLR